MDGQKGYTLSELVVSLGIFSILVLIVSTLSSWAIFRYYSVRDRLIAEETAYRAEGAFRSAFGQAIDVGFSPHAVPATLAGPAGAIHGPTVVGGPVQARRFVFDRMGASANWTRIATFYREQGTALGAGAATQGLPRMTAIFYREPTVNTSGVIFFDLSSTNGTVAERPGYDDFFIDRVSSFAITKRKHQVYNKVTSIDVDLSIRYHMFYGNQQSWCPQVDIRNNVGGCRNGATYKDIRRQFTVVLANNLMRGSGAGNAMAVDQEERTLGNLYLFRMVNPLRYQ